MIQIRVRLVGTIVTSSHHYGLGDVAPGSRSLDVLCPRFVAQFDHTMSEGKKSKVANSGSTSTHSSGAAAAPDADDGVTWKVLPRIAPSHSALNLTLHPTSTQHTVARIRQTQQVIRTPNPDNQGYARQKQNGKLWVRERLDALLDDGSFNEVGSLTGKPVLDETTGKMKDYLPAYVCTMLCPV